jgi:hypothetical protein
MFYAILFVGKSKDAMAVSDVLFWQGHPPRGRCHSESFAVILSEAKNLALSAQGKLREESLHFRSG